LAATHAVQTTVTSAAATPVVTSTTTSNVVINTVSTSTVTAFQTSYPFSPYFNLRDSNNNYISYDGSGSNAFALTFDAYPFISEQTDSQSRLNYGYTCWARVNSITGLDRVQLIGNGDSAHALFYTLGDRAAGTGSFTYAVRGPKGQQNILQNCNSVLYIGTTVKAGCQQVTLTADAFNVK
jgi:hypothetical protein